MSMDYNGFSGYGLEVNYAILRDEIDDLEAMLGEITSKNNLLDFCHDDDRNYYLYFPEMLPWQIPERAKNLTQDDVVTMITEALQPYLAVPIEDIVPNIDYCYGCYWG